MKDKSNYEITENDIELEKLCADSVELINYARNMVVNHVNIVQIMTYVSWSHYLQLMHIKNEAERSFYEIETAKTGWGVRTLQRQYNSNLYEHINTVS